jgi:hypothetical protein
MADDLKAMLDQVKSGNGKRFFFAFGTGKRSDGAGDGHLIVGAAGKKPKKSDVQAACACQAFVEGECWAAKSDNGTTYYFTGKPALAAPMVAKMALTAKKLAGKQYDFQVPSPEQETVKAPEGNQDGAGKDLAEQWKANFAEWSPTVELAIRYKGPAMGEIQRLKAQAVASSKPGGDMARALELWTEAFKLAREDTKEVFEKRLNALSDQVEKSGVLPPAINDMISLLGSASARGDRGDYGEGSLDLDRIEEMLKKATSSAGGKSDSEGTPKDRLKELLKKVNGKGTKWESHAEAKELIKKAEIFVRQGDTRHATETLDELAALVG